MPGACQTVISTTSPNRRWKPLSDRFSSWIPRFDAGRFLTAELLLFVATAACFTLAHNDTYWHLAAGRGMVESGRVMLTDEFSHTNYGAPWLNYEWLSQVVFYDAYRVGGMPLLTALCAALAAGSCLLAWWLVRGPIEHRVLLMGLALPLVTPGWSLRPQAFSMCLMMMVLHVVLRERFLALPFLFLLWANFHGAVALGFVVLGADLLAAAFSGSAVLRRAAYGLLSFGATLLTPLGWALWPEVWRSVHRSPVNRISEWLRPSFAPEFVLFWMLALVLLWLGLTRWHRLDRREDRTLVLVSLFMLLLAVRASRNVVPFGLVMAPAVSVLLWREEHRRRPVPVPGRSVAPLLRALAFAGSLVAAVIVVAQHWFASSPPADWTPVSREAAAAIRSCPGPIYNHYDTGGFIIWFVPEQRVFLDSRQDPYPDELLRAQREATSPADLLRLVERYHTRCAVLRPDSPAVSVLRSQGWMPLYSDSPWTVMARPARSALPHGAAGRSAPPNVG